MFKSLRSHLALLTVLIATIRLFPGSANYRCPVGSKCWERLLGRR